MEPSTSSSSVEAGQAPGDRQSPAPPRLDATRALERALNANTPLARVRYARAGLAGRCDLETQGLLLRQVHLGELECGHPDRALQAAEQMIALQVLLDVACQDAARACTVLGRYEEAVEHLQRAVECAPSERQAVHLSTLGGLLFALGRSHEAIAPLQRALKLPNDGAPSAVLLGAQLALARADEDSASMELAYHELLHDPAGDGYGRFLLGELAFARGERMLAKLHLESFLSRVRRQRVAVQAGLSAEIACAENTLGHILMN